MKYSYWLTALAAWVAMAYGVRYGLMEHTAWVGACAAAPEQLACGLKAGLGLAIHWGVLPWAGMVLAGLGWLMSGRAGQWAAAGALVLAVPALVLYTTTLAGVVAMLAGLRLARARLA